MRLDKYIMNALQISRNDAKKIIKKKEIEVNGIINQVADTQVKDEDIITYKGKKLVYKENIYLMMNKPKGFVCANIDNVNKTIFELINDYDVSKLSVVGRLDKDTEGLLLITTDGLFLHNLTSPKHEVFKKYYVECEGTFEEEDVEKFNEGITIKEEDGKLYKCKPAILKIIDSHKGYISIKEGKFHQIKKMCAAVNKKVIYLKRISIGELNLDDKLKVSEYRELTDEELNLLIKK